MNPVPSTVKQPSSRVRAAKVDVARPCSHAQRDGEGSRVSQARARGVRALHSSCRRRSFVRKESKCCFVPQHPAKPAATSGLSFPATGAASERRVRHVYPGGAFLRAAPPCAVLRNLDSPRSEAYALVLRLFFTLCFVADSRR